MRNIVLARVDDRLIHGQVVSGWLPRLRINYLMIVDDELAGNVLMKRVLAASVPERITFKIYSVEHAGEVLMRQPKSDRERMMLLTKTPLAFARLMDMGCEIPSVNLGGMGMHGERTPFFRNISCTDEEREVLRRMAGQGTEVFYQLVPEQKKFTAEEMGVLS